MGDPRAKPSEEYAFEHLGLSINEQIKSEYDLITEFEGCCVPEAIFNHNGKNISVEVKRIIGNQLPIESTGRRVIRRRKQIVWPWKSTVEASLSKLNESIVHRYHIQEHHVVIVVPDNLTGKAHRKLLSHVYDTQQVYLETTPCVLKHNHIFLHVIKGDVELFDRM